MIYCENDACRFCIDGICGNNSIHLEMMADWAVCMSEEEPDDYEEI